MTQTPPSPPAPRRLGRWLLMAGVVAVAVLALLAGLLNVPAVQRLALSELGGLRTESGLGVKVGGFRGSLLSSATLEDIAVLDQHGVFAQIPQLELHWNPLAGLSGRVAIERLHAPQASILRKPELLATPPTDEPLLPDISISLGSLRIDRLTLGRALMEGDARVVRVDASGTLYRRVMDLRASITAEQGGDLALLEMRAGEVTRQFDLEARAVSPAGGVLARVAGLPEGFALVVTGDGDWAQWRGRLRALIGGKPLATLRLRQNNGLLSAGGRLLQHPRLPKAANSLIHEAAIIGIAGRLKDRTLSAALQASSARGSLLARGIINLDSRAVPAAALTARLADTGDIIPEIRAQELSLSARGSGIPDDFRVEIDATAEAATRRTIAVSRPKLSAVIASKDGTLSGPVTLAAGRITGVDRQADPWLRDLVLSGPLRLERAKQDLSLDGVRLTHPNGTATVRGSVVLKDFTGRLAVEAALKALDMPGQARISGGTLKVDVTLNGKALPAITGTADLRSLEPHSRAIARWLGGPASLASRFAWSRTDGMRIERLILGAPLAEVTGVGRLGANGAITGQVQARLASLAGAGHPESGAVTARATIGGLVTRPTIKATAFVPKLIVAGQTFAQVRADITPTGDEHRLRLDGRSSLGPLNTEAIIRLADTIDIRELQASLGDWSLTGGLSIRDTLANGDLLLSGRGLRANLRAMADGGVQHIRFAASAERARIAPGVNFAIGSLRGAGDVRLGATPQVTATLSVEDAVYQDIALDRLRLDARPIAGDQHAIDLQLLGTRDAAFNVSSAIQLGKDGATVTLRGALAEQALSTAAPAQIVRRGAVWTLEPARLQIGTSGIDLSGVWEPQAASLRANARDFDLGLLQFAAPRLTLSGRASSSLTAAWQNSRLKAADIALAIRGLRRSGLSSASTPVDVQITGRLDHETAGLALDAHVGATQVGLVRLKIQPVSGATTPLVDRIIQAPIQGRVRWNGPAESLWALAAQEGHDVAGPIALRADISGLVGDPDVRGQFRARGARYENLQLGAKVTDFTMQGSFAGPTIKIEEAQGKVGKQGTIGVSGTATLSSARGWPAAIRMTLNNAELISRDDADIQGTGTIDLSYGPDGGNISGKLEVPRARVRLGGAARTTIPQIEVRETGLSVRPVLPEQRRKKPWRLDLAIDAPQRVNVSGNGLVSEWRSRLSVTGTVNAPQINGRLDLIRGNYEFAGRRFDLSRGDITFSGSGTDPALDIVATAPIDGGTAIISIGGTGRQPRVTFSSSPALPQDEVLARLLFGASVANLSAPDAVQLASALAKSAGRGLDVIGQVQRLTGIDRIRVLGPDAKRGTGTVYAGGKYITDRVYVEVRTDGAGYTATVFEIALTRTLSILSELATLGGTNASLNWSRDY